ncbi:MAG: MraY family glycosyltransferase [Planctomycetota bacterium]
MKVSPILMVLTFIISFFVSFYTTPVAQDAAKRFGVMDEPDDTLKAHREAIPYFGGLSIYLSFLIGISLVFKFDANILGILLGGSIIVLVGLIDDLGGLSPGAKLTGELIAVYVLVKSGIRIEIAFLPVSLQYLLTFLWMITMINAFNIIDIMDGLSAGVGAIGAVFMFIVSVINGNTNIAILSLALAGAIAGFLPYNFHPATIFMGDCGSLLLGFLLGAFSMIGKYTTYNHMALIVPAIIFGVPLFDTLFVSYIRLRRKESVFKGSKDHFALRLRKWRLSVRQTVLFSYGVSTLCGLFGIAIMVSTLMIASALLLLQSVVFLGTGLWLKKIDMTM